MRVTSFYVTLFRPADLPLLGAAIFLLVIVSLQAGPALAQDDDDFIILDDRGDQTPEPESPARSQPADNSDDVSIDGRRREARTRQPAEPPAAGPAPPPPRRFEPSERVSEDLSVSFPADI